MSVRTGRFANSRLEAAREEKNRQKRRAQKAEANLHKAMERAEWMEKNRDDWAQAKRRESARANEEGSRADTAEKHLRELLEAVRDAETDGWFDCNNLVTTANRIEAELSGGGGKGTSEASSAWAGPTPAATPPESADKTSEAEGLKRIVAKGNISTPEWDDPPPSTPEPCTCDHTLACSRGEGVSCDCGGSDDPSCPVHSDPIPSELQGTPNVGSSAIKGSGPNLQKLPEDSKQASKGDPKTSKDLDNPHPRWRDEIRKQIQWLEAELESTAGRELWLEDTANSLKASRDTETARAEDQIRRKRVAQEVTERYRLDLAAAQARLSTLEAAMHKAAEQLQTPSWEVGTTPRRLALKTLHDALRGEG